VVKPRPGALLGLAPLVFAAACADVWGLRDLSGSADAEPPDATTDVAAEGQGSPGDDADATAPEAAGDEGPGASQDADAGTEVEASGDARPDGGPEAEAGCGSLEASANCGACGQACNTATGTPSCNGTRCSYTCVSGRTDCNATSGANTDGCECATPACCGTSCQTTHATGLTSPAPTAYYDCNPVVAPVTQTQARGACLAFTGSAAACLQTTSGNCSCGLLCSTTATSICGSAGGKCYCWQYTGQYPGTVQTESASACSATCGASSDPKFN
jgi:hypothetical protein